MKLMFSPNQTYNLITYYKLKSKIGINRII